MHTFKTVIAIGNLYQPITMLFYRVFNFDNYCEGIQRVYRVGKRHNTKSWRLKLNINNFVVKVEDNIWNKNACLYRKTGVGKGTVTERTKSSTK